MRKLLLFIAVVFATLANAQTITVTAPNGGEVWAGCTVHNITWTSSGTSGFFSVDYSTNGGTTWTSLATNLAASTYSWTIPNTSSTNCMVRVFDYNTPATADQSNSPFTITAPLILTSPNGGESWQVGGPTHNITWVATGTGTNLTIEYSTNAGGTWTAITTTAVASSGSYTWTIPNIPSTQCLVRIRDAATPCMTDASDNLFTIAPGTPTITVTAPNTSLTYYVAQSYNITWTSQYLVSPNVMIEYSTDNGTSWITIVSSVANSGSYAWTVPNTLSAQCLVRVSEFGNPTANDVSNVNFTIASPFITVTSPNLGTENWQGCSSQTITWTRGGTVNNAKIEYSLNGGTTWTTIVASYNAGAGTSCSYTWGTVPNTPSNNCLIRVTDVTLPTATDVSNAPFTISQNTAIIVNTPNGGEVWQVGGPTQNITWAASGTSTSLTIQYSTDNGTTWTTITTTAVASSGTYAWTIPNTPSTQCLVKIIDASNTCKFDVSNAVFTISPPTPVITVITPNTALTYYVGTAYNINWTSAYLSSSFVKLEYSTDNGATWITIVASVTNSGSYSWTTPNTPSTLCLVRVSEYGNPVVNDISNVNFTIASPFITVTSPNLGTENWQGCSSQTITWTRGGTVNNAKIEYSLNGGTTWTTIVASYNAGAGTSCSYTWGTVPNTPSNNCLIRVTDVTLPTATDVSNAPFTISQNTAIIVNTPNGGEVWQVGGPTQNITWAAAGTSTSLTIQYSIDNGTTWTTITTTATASSGTYAWTIPNTPSTQCLVKIFDASNTCKFDISDAVFTISPGTPTITVISPNTAVTYYVGTAYNINWTSQYLSSPNVMIEYSFDNGTTWSTIVASVTNSGSYSWTAPNTPSTLCLVRVSEYGNPVVNDISNVNFTIASPFITVTSPNLGTENWQGCSSQTITWTRGGTVNNAKIEYSLNGGTTWTTIVASYNAGAGTSCSYTWGTVPNTPSNNCLIRVTDVTLPTATDVSNAPFTISQNTAIIVNTPNGGEVWQVGGPTQNITWAASGTSTSLTIQYSTDNGTTWTTITTTAVASSGTYAWTIPNTPSTQCLVKIIDASNTCKFDVSNAVFTISPPTPVITVITPNTALTYYVGTAYNINWTSAYLSSSFVKLEYSTDNGATWITIVASVTNSGSYSWTTPNTPSTQCLVRVSEYGNPVVNDISNVNFTIASPFITVTSPNLGTENWQGCSTQNITWTRGGTTNNAKIEYSIDGGTTWNTIVASYNAGAGTSCTYSWAGVPNTPSNNCLIRVTDVTITTATDVSNAPFTISQNTAIIVNTPNGGEVWQVGGPTQNITWAAAGTSTSLTIQYSINNGTTWTTITTTATASSGTYAWTIPNTPSTQCLVKIFDASNTCKFDISDAVFTIATPTPVITVTSPNTAVTWYAANTYNITWTSVYLSSSFVKLEYSTDNGTTWITIVASVTNSGAYSWIVPNTPSTQCLVRVSEFGNPVVNDISDVNFTIAAPLITVTSPNTAVTWYVSAVNNITWTNTTLSGPNVKLEYSIDNGASWLTIVASTANTNSYAWTIPNNPSTQCLVKVSDAASPATFDISNINFTIAIPVITVTSPNGGENWQGCSTQNITWNRTGTTNNAKIEYSLNGGTTWTTIVASYYAGTGTTGTYTWGTVPNTPSTNCLIRVTDVTVPASTDVSNTPFTISQNTAIVINTPNGGEVWQVGGPTRNITWAAIGTSTNLTIQYSTDNGSTWTTITTTANAAAGSYTWTLPNTPSTQCLVKVIDASNTCKFDVSDAVFTITPPTPIITVTAPNTALTYYVASTYNITWTSAYITSSFVKIEYSIDNGGTWIVISAASNNTGTYSWTVPNTPSSQCLVRVSEFGNPVVNDISNVNFTIAPAITVTAPNGGENLGSCTTTSINWTAGGCSGNYKLEYSINGGSTWLSITTSYAAAATGACSYTWTLPTTPSTNCLVRVTDVSAAAKTDVSNTAFTISPAITVTQPNFGGSYVVGSTLNITWTSSGVSNFYNIDYSTNGGTTWNSIVFNANIFTNSYLWTIPNAPSTNCLVRVTDNVNTCKKDQSDVVFTITTTAAAITVTAPNGGEDWQTCSTQNINWTASGTSGTYNLDYSVNGGSTWTSIITGYAAAGSACSYAWTIPNSISATALVRVTDASVPTRVDQSDAAFSMSGLSLVATGTTAICSGSAAALNATGTTSYSWAPATGLSATNVANPTATPTTTTTYTVTGTTGGCSNTATVTITVNPVPTVGVSPASGIVCAGGSTTLMASGATAYTWLPATGLSSTTAPTVTASPSANITYTVTGTTSGCSATAISDITVNPIPVISTTGAGTICAGTSASLNASGATTYTWSPGTGLSSTTVANPTATPTVSITYTVSGTTAGCTGTTSVPVTVSPLPNVATSGNASICLGSSAAITASGATTYSWSPATGLSATNIANPVASPTATTTYTVTGTTAGCSNSTTVIVTVNPVPTVTSTGTATVCAGTSTPLTASGASTYLWSPATGLSSSTVANPTATPSATTTYTVTGTATGCTGTSSVTVTVTPIPVIAVAGTTTICNGSTTTLTASGATTYSWSPATGLSATNIANPVASPTATTTYTVTGNTGACSGTRTVTVTVNPIPTVNASGTNTVCAGGSTSLGASGATTYAWLPTTGLSNAAIASPLATPAATTTYTVTGTTSGCSASATATVTVTPLPVISIAGVTGFCSGGSTSLTASGATTYAWSPATGLSATNVPNPTVAPASTTTYTVSGTTGSCTGTTTVTVTVNSVPTIAIAGTTTICAGNSTTLTASGAATYAWSPATGLSNPSIANPVANPTTTTSYTVTGTNGVCSNTNVVTVTVNPAPTVAVTGTASICSGTSTPLSASGATTYAWLPTTGLSSASVASPTATPTATTTYTVTGTTAGCSASATATVTVSPTPVIAIAGTTTICNGSSTTLTASGATTYSWLPATGLSATNIANPSANPTATTTYTVTGTTGTCSATRTVTVTVNPLPTVAATGTNSICPGTSTPLSASGATTYAWSPTTGLSSATIASPTATPAATTTYVVTGTTSGCSATASVTVTINAAPTASAGTPATICSGSSTTLNASGGTTYAWLPATGLSATNIANPVASPAATTTYTVTVGNGGSCTATSTVVVTVNPIPTANAGADVTVACGGSTTLTASGGTTYVWSPATGLSNPNIAGPVATPPYSITYTVTVSNGTCSATDAVVVTAGTLTANAGPDVTICAGNSTTLSGSSTGGGTPAWLNLASSYAYTQNVASYTAITGGTVWLNSASTSMDDVISSSITIPAFKFNNITYTNIYISTNGFITLGTAAIPSSTTYNPISSTETYAAAISAMGVDLNKYAAGTPEIRYQQVGNEFIVQWKDMGRYTSGSAIDRLSFQVRLNTVTNQVNIVYASTSLLGSSISYPEVGLRGANNTFATNVSNRNVISTTGAWVNSTAGTNNAATCYYNSATTATVPANGTTFTWSLPTATTTYAWSPATGLSSTTSATPVATPAATTTYTLTATSGSCTAVDQVTVTVVSGTSVSAGADVSICGGSSTTLAATGGGTYSWSPATGLSATNIANPVASPAATTTYTVTVSSGSCSFTDNVVVTVNPLPATPSAISGSPTICAGSTNTYSISPVSGATSYTWILPGSWTGTSTTPSISATASTTGGVISVVANNACGSGAAQNLTVAISTAPAQPAAISGSMSVCQGLSNTYSVAAVSGATSYTWTFPSGFTGTSTTNSITTTAGASGGTISVTANNSCGISTPQTATVTVNPVPAQPGVITGSTSFCAGTAQTYSIDPVSGASSYTWSLPGGWSGTSTTNTISTTAGSTSGNINVTANNTCGSSTAQTVAVIVNTIPAAPASISGSASVCAGTANTYVAASVTGATSYTWTLPGGWIGSSITPTINTTASTTGGTITVVANNSCGTGAAQTLNVNINSIPAQPASISGATSVCDGTANTFSVTSVSGATSYTWTLPGVWTGTSATNSIVATAVTTGGTISVTADNACGSGAAQTIVVAVNTAPAQPAAISGTSTICEGSSQAYSVTADASATGYTWTLPATWTGASTTNSITATTGALSGTISVTANNACGSSAAQTFAATVNPLPATPGTISGNTTICGAGTQTYSIAPVAGAAAYTWTIPSGWSGTSVTESITVATDNNPGTVAVYASNGCGNSATTQLTVSVQAAPVQPVLAAADSSICDGAAVSYSVVADAGASSYTWTLPAAWTGTSTTNSLNGVAHINSGVITVTENNACGSSTPLTINVTVNAIPNVTLASFNAVCDNAPAFALTGGTPAGGTYSGTGVTGGTTFTPGVSGAGNFTITYTYSDAHSCSASDTSNIHVDLCTGIAANTGNNTIAVYPNPFSEYTTVSIGTAIQLNGTEIHIFDVLGKEVMIFTNIHSYEVRIDRKDLRDGVYFYRLINDNKELSSGKLIIQ